MKATPCTFDGCDKPRKYRLYCQGHYLQEHRGRPMAPIGSHAEAAKSAEQHCADLYLTPIPGYLGYAASPNGSIWAVGTNWRGYGARPLDARLDQGGYPYVRLRVDGRRVRSTVHRLVALAFLGPRAEGQQVRHLNGVRTDSRVENLARGSAQENADDRDLHGTTVRGSRVSQAKLTEEQVVEARRRFLAGETQSDLASAYGVSVQCMHQVVRRKWWKHL